MFVYNEGCAGFAWRNESDLRQTDVGNHLFLKLKNLKVNEKGFTDWRK